jgi:hypothetical protein
MSKVTSEVLGFIGIGLLALLFGNSLIGFIILSLMGFGWFLYNKPRESRIINIFTSKFHGKKIKPKGDFDDFYDVAKYVRKYKKDLQIKINKNDDIVDLEEELKDDFHAFSSEISKALKNLDYDEYLQTYYWKRVSAIVKNRDNNECVKCGSVENLEVHHSSYKYKGYEYNFMEDLITLCDICHEKTHNEKDSNRI